MRYFRAKERENFRGAAYQLYVTQGVSLLVEAVASVRMTDFAELINLKQADKRSGEEIAADIITRAGLEVTKPNESF